MKYIIILFLFLCIEADGQALIKKKDLQGIWFTSNADSLFYKSDTLLLFKKQHKENRDDIPLNEREYIESETEMSGSQEYVELDFRKRKKLLIGGANRDLGVRFAWIVSNWSFKKNIIIINNYLGFESFKIISTGKQNLISDYKSDNGTNQEKLTVFTITIIRTH